MPTQRVPDITSDFFTLNQIKELLDDGKIFINKEYQRGDIWKNSQRIELIRSIENSYSIGVLVLFVNDDNQFEILDGQQRILTIAKYLSDDIDLKQTELPVYSNLETREKTLFDAYCVYYLKLKSHDPESKEEDIVQTFLRLQEGTPLNKAEKLNAQRGKFKDYFVEIRKTHPLFTFFGKEKRFRFRQLAAELLLLELDTNFEKLIFPDLKLSNMIKGVKKYERNLKKSRQTFFKGNLDFLHMSLNLILSAFKVREVIPFYLLVSYLRRTRAGNANLKNELSEFAKEFLKNLNSFSIYDSSPPPGIEKSIFDTYKNYKHAAKILTTPDSISKRFEIILTEFKRLRPYITKDPNRFHDTEQKRTLFFRQKGKCPECDKKLNFHNVSAHHGIHHSEGGKTDDLENSYLLHHRCHRKFERRLANDNQKTLKLDKNILAPK
ncbi:MAG: DUF262 domain-containing protein [Calditrichaeota bacterium]|jgi:hypothetical protein|nr:DUF262 domain-containing protein [Calditrichota bacterium]